METIDRLINAVQYPLDDPSQTLLAVLVVVVAGLLLAVALIAVASPGRTQDDYASVDSNADNDADDSPIES